MSAVSMGAMSMSAAASPVIDVQAFVDESRLSRFQILVVALCFLTIAADGFDTAAIGYIAPALRAQWKLEASQLAPLFAAGLFGLMAGALVFGPLADRVGRKAVLVLTTVAFGLASMASASAGSPETLTLWRFATGVGLGGAMPSAITLTSEFCPAGRRSFLVTTMFCGFAIGSAAGGLRLLSDREPRDRGELGQRARARGVRGGIGGGRVSPPPGAAAVHRVPHGVRPRPAGRRGDPRDGPLRPDEAALA